MTFALSPYDFRNRHAPMPDFPSKEHPLVLPGWAVTVALELAKEDLTRKAIEAGLADGTITKMRDPDAFVYGGTTANGIVWTSSA